MKYFALLFCLVLAACEDDTLVSKEDFKVLSPKPFGYVIGDEIPQQIELTLKHGGELDISQLPALGPINRWLTLKNLQVKTTDNLGAKAYRIELLYQVFYAPLEVKMLTIPGFELHIKNGADQASQAVPAWNFTIAPLRELAVRKDDSGEYMRPDNLPEFLALEAPQRVLSLAGLLAFCSAAFLVYLYGYFPGLGRRSIFKRALHELNQASGEDADGNLAIMHRALNQLNRKPLFQHQLEDFFKHHPVYRSLERELNWFFELSKAYFFGGEAVYSAEQHARLQQFCRRCRVLERSV